MYLILAFKTLYNKTLITSPTSFITTLFNDSIASLQPFLLSLKHTNVPQTHTSTFDVCPVAFPRCMACSLLTKDNCCCSFNSLQPQGLQHARPPCPSPSPEVCPSSYSLHQQWHPAISSSDALFSFYSQSFPTSGTFPMRQLFALVISFAQSFPTLWPHGLQHARPPCPSPTPGVYSNSCALSRWCHPTISSSAVPFSSHLQSFPASGSFPMSWFFKSGGQSIGISASTSVLRKNIQGWFPSGWTRWISLQSNGLSRVFSNTTVQKHQFFSAQLSL